MRSTFRTWGQNETTNEREVLEYCLHHIGGGGEAELAYAARVMRSVVVDFARQGSARRRGGQDVHIALETDAANLPAGEAEIIRVHEALEELATFSERLVRVVEMRYFGGMSEAEIAEALGLTERTVRRDWEKARILLASALKRH